MKTTRFLRFLVALLLLMPLVSLAACETTPDDTYSAAREIARTEIWKDINSGKASSGSVAIMDNGSVVYREGFGVADREKSLPVDTDTIFNMGSISKAFCAEAVMLLVDDGKVELDAPVTRYLPEFKMADPRYKDITVRMLLDHSSGLPGSQYANTMGYAYNDQIYEETLARLAKAHLKAAPGATAPYCNDGWTLAEMLIAKVSGQKYIDFLRTRMFEKLRLSKAGLGVGLRNDAQVAEFYNPQNGKKHPGEVLSIVGAGGLSATPTDLVIFGDSLTPEGSRVLSEDAVAEMTRPSQSLLAKKALEETGINPEAAWGLGLDVVEPSWKGQGVKVIGKGGSTTYYHSMLFVAPEERISVAVMECGLGKRPQDIAGWMLDSVLEAKGSLKKAETEVGPEASPQEFPPEYAALAGRYAGGQDSWNLSFDYDRKVARLTTMSGDDEDTSTELSYYDGLLHDESGAAYKLISLDGRTYLLSQIFGVYYMTKAEKVDAAATPQELASDLNGTMWLRRNAVPYEDTGLAASYILPAAVPASLPGYVDIAGLKRIGSPTFAGMFLDDARDQTELFLVDKDGKTWLHVSEMVFSPVDDAAALGAGEKTVTIGKDGYNEWFKTTEDLVVSFKKPEDARAVVMVPGEVQYDSAIDNGEVFVKAGSFIELGGMPGDALTVKAVSQAGK